MFGKRTRAPAGGKDHFERKWAHFVINRLRKDPAEVLRELNAAVKWANVAKYPLYTTYAFVAMRGGFSALKCLELAEFFERFVLRLSFPDARHKLAFEVGVTLVIQGLLPRVRKVPSGRRHPRPAGAREIFVYIGTKRRKAERKKAARRIDSTARGS